MYSLPFTGSYNGILGLYAKPEAHKDCGRFLKEPSVNPSKPETLDACYIAPVQAKVSMFVWEVETVS